MPLPDNAKSSVSWKRQIWETLANLIERLWDKKRNLGIQTKSISNSTFSTVHSANFILDLCSWVEWFYSGTEACRLVVNPVWIRQLLSTCNLHKIQVQIQKTFRIYSLGSSKAVHRPIRAFVRVDAIHDLYTCRQQKGLVLSTTTTTTTTAMTVVGLI